MLDLRSLCHSTYCSPISSQNERRALQQLDVLLAELASEYSTSEDDDRNLLESGKISPKDGARWHGVVIRLGEKRLISRFRKLLKIVDPLFSLSYTVLLKQISANLGNAKAHWSGIDTYIKENVTSLVIADR